MCSGFPSRDGGVKNLPFALFFIFILIFFSVGDSSKVELLGQSGMFQLRGCGGTGGQRGKGAMEKLGSGCSGGLMPRFYSAFFAPSMGRRAPGAAQLCRADEVA